MNTQEAANRVGAHLSGRYGVNEKVAFDPATIGLIITVITAAIKAIMECHGGKEAKAVERLNNPGIIERWRLRLLATDALEKIPAHARPRGVDAQRLKGSILASLPITPQEGVALINHTKQVFFQAALADQKLLNTPADDGSDVFDTVEIPMSLLEEIAVLANEHGFDDVPYRDTSYERVLSFIEEARLARSKKRSK